MNNQAWKILLVEDSEDDYILTREMLNDVKAGQYEMVWADRYERALAALQTFQPDVALVDYNLGPRNGVDLIRAIRDRGFRFPVILLTGISSYALDMTAMQAGVSDFVDKMQMSGQLLERAIRYAIEQQQIRLRLEQMNEELEARVRERTQALEEAQTRLRAVVDNAPLILWSTDRDGTINLLEGRGLARLGLAPGQFIGQTIDSYTARYPEVAGHLHRTLAGEEVTASIPLGKPYDEVLEAYCTPLLDDDRQISGIIGVSTFITERLKAEEQARLAAQRLEAQADLSRRMTEARLDVQATVDILARCTTAQLGDASLVTLLGEDQTTLIPIAFHHHNPKGQALLAALMTPEPIAIEDGLSGQVARTGETLLIHDLSQDLICARLPSRYRPYLDQVGLHSVMVVPLRVQGRVIGTLGVSRDRPGNPYTLEDQRFLEGLADRGAMAIENARLYQTVQEELAERHRIEAELSEIQSRLTDGAEAERLQLSRELHDGPIQDLYAISIQLRFLKPDTTEEKKNAIIEEVQGSLQRVADTLRAAAVTLRPPALTRFGLESAMRSYIGQFQHIQPELAIYMDLDDDHGPDGPVLPERIRLALFRIFQVALTNVARHARATRVDLRLRIEEQVVQFEIQDNGIGFRVPARWVELARQGHIGLVGAMERAEGLGGKMQVISEPGQGTLLRVTLPRTE